MRTWGRPGAEGRGRRSEIHRLRRLHGLDDNERRKGPQITQITRIRRKGSKSKANYLTSYALSKGTGATTRAASTVNKIALAGI